MNALCGLTDFASKAVGGSVIKASNEKFGSSKNLIKAPYSQTIQTDNHDSKPNHNVLHNPESWVTRRHNQDHDWVIIKLGSICTIAGFGISTEGLTYDAASELSIEACFVPEEIQHKCGKDPEKLPFFWETLLPKVPIKPDTIAQLALWNETKAVYNFVKINIYPDGGLTRVNIYGSVAPLFESSSLVDLACVTNGGTVVYSSDSTIGKPENLILPGYSHFDSCHGWVTKRKHNASDQDYDHVIIKLGDAGYLKKATIESVGLDGVQPKTVVLHACKSENNNPDVPYPINWYKISDEINTSTKKTIKFDLNLPDELFTHVKMLIYPDGGISRLRIFGEYESSEQSSSDSNISTEPTPALNTENDDQDSAPADSTTLEETDLKVAVETESDSSDFIKVSNNDADSQDLTPTSPTSKSSKKTSSRKYSESFPPQDTQLEPVLFDDQTTTTTISITGIEVSVEPFENQPFQSRPIATPKRSLSKNPIILQSPPQIPISNGFSGTALHSRITTSKTTDMPNDSSPPRKRSTIQTDDAAIPSTQASDPTVARKSSKNRRSKKSKKSTAPES
ncbi:hypothetical protein BB560_004024 [Smittium megazygosporum]|uniref:Allantoicase domain-containing protein n=1 Tax=Smittium megazygosporum TaxID=133381 RepID=A0A2T9ZAF0_9FUNG|nr:hypothetical protein BB560_004024 [Smittium megazygosporum]